MAKTKVHGEFLKDSVVRFTAKAGENITKGQAVYISGISGEVAVVSLADADDTAKMPAFGLAEATVSTNAEVEITSFGTLKGLDTSSYSLGDILYVDTTAGSLTNNPSGLEATKLQNIGIVQRVHATSGSIKVGGAGRTNAVPNLDDGDIFIGDSNNKAVSDSFTNVLNSEAGINSSADATAITIDASENVGIGVSPTQKLQVKTATDKNFIVLDASGVRLQATNDAGTTLDTLKVAGNPLIFLGSGGAETARIDSSGNVGIGTSSPLALLDVAVLSSGARRLLVNYADSLITLQGANSSSTNETLRVTGDNLRFATGSGTGTERMRIDSSGRVLVGATSSAVHSNVDDLQIGNGTGSRGIGIHSANNANGAIFFSDPDSTLAGQIEYSHDRDDFVFVTGTTTRLRIDSDGLKFGSDTAAANALDDYEEGTWTPELTVGGGSFTYNYRAASYRKVGNMVNIIAGIGLSSVSSLTGNLSISGLPFTNGSGEGHVASVSFSVLRNFSQAFDQFRGYVDSGATTITLAVNYTNTGHSYPGANTLTATTQIYFSVTYNVS